MDDEVDRVSIITWRFPKLKFALFHFILKNIDLAKKFI